MRRPHPYYLKVRRAWITKAGGKLHILLKGPKNADTEARAWEAFYLYMARLGQPVEQAVVSTLSVGQLADRFDEWLEREVNAGRTKPRTYDYYHGELQRFLDHVGVDRAAAGVLPHQLEMYKTNWHSVQAVQRLYNWGVKMGLLRENQLRGVVKPDAGVRQRVLTLDEQKALIDGADKHFQPFLVAMLHTIARPQEVRALQWKHLTLEPAMFVLTEFKAKKRRKDRATAVRRILLDDVMVELLEEMAAARKPKPEDHVFLDRRRRPWTANAVRCRMKRLREKLGMEKDENGENIVAYSLRHTSATKACASGVPDRVLAELMGHANPTTTRRYQHPQLDHLVAAIRKATKP